MYMKAESFNQIPTWKVWLNREKFEALFAKFVAVRNPHALTEVALSVFFDTGNKDALHIALPLLDFLKRGAHMSAAYALGILLCVYYGRKSQRGMDLLQIFICQENVHLLPDCRRIFDRNMSEAWGNQHQYLRLRKKRLCTEALNDNRAHYFGWPVFDSEVHALDCKDCAKDHLIRNVRMGLGRV